jgi:hypothetical protein
MGHRGVPRFTLKTVVITIVTASGRCLAWAVTARETQVRAEPTCRASPADIERLTREDLVMVNIYLPDDLAAAVMAELGEASISGIAQNALRAEVARARGLQLLADEHGFHRVEAREGDDDVAFQGRKIGSTDGLAAYLTPKRNVVVVDERGNRLLDVYDECQAFIDDYGDSGRPGAREMVRDVAKALGVKSGRELDI